MGKRLFPSPFWSRFPSRCPSIFETLESRVLLASDLGPITDVVWHGQHAQAIAGQYVAQTPHPNAFFGLAARAGFSDIKSLGGNGFYKFDSGLSPATVARIAAKYSAAISAVQPNFVRHAAD